MNPDDHDEDFDPLPGYTAHIDQAIEMSGQMARLSYAQFDALTEAGFCYRQALYLVACNMNDGPGEVP